MDRSWLTGGSTFDSAAFLKIQEDRRAEQRAEQSELTGFGGQEGRAGLSAGQAGHPPPLLLRRPARPSDEALKAAADALLGPSSDESSSGEDVPGRAPPPAGRSTGGAGVDSHRRRRRRREEKQKQAKSEKRHKRSKSERAADELEVHGAGCLLDGGSRAVFGEAGPCARRIPVRLLFFVSAGPRPNLFKHFTHGPPPLSMQRIAKLEKQAGEGARQARVERWAEDLRGSRTAPYFIDARSVPCGMFAGRGRAGGGRSATAGADCAGRRPAGWA